MSDFESVSFDEEELLYESSDNETYEQSKRVKTVPYVLMKLHEAQNTVEALASDLSELLSITKDEAVLLLRYTKFDTQKAQDFWYEVGEETARAKAGIVTGTVARNAEKPFTCQICYEEVSAEGGWQLGCGHPFCERCWKTHLEVMVREGKECLLARCPAFRCTEKVPHTFIRQLLSKEKKENQTQSSLDRYQQFFLQSFIDDMPDMKFCPNPEGCEMVVHRLNNLMSTDVICECGYSFCFNCSHESHRPADCECVAEWEKFNNDSSHTSMWILANTKPCPKCKKNIEKNQGCNHMTCSCGSQFCWVCLGDWSTHGGNSGGYYNCNVYKKTDTDKKIESARKSVDKHLFFFERFMNHGRAMKFVVNDLEALEKRHIALVSASQCDLHDLAFIKDALELILVCRRALKWTYAMGFCMEENAPEKDLFEFLQKNLESNVEKLHSMYETKGLAFLKKLRHASDDATLSVADVLEEMKQFREEMINYTSVTRKFKEKLLEGIENGLTNNFVA
eukprot:GDKJ01005224.1.p1 GENE.GDKJ01005224.1~~GDKJ01005224.1.p1  ORF type:complete len:508 (+),score=81.82 GDKJ01005224.1:15-1538(+)